MSDLVEVGGLGLEWVLRAFDLGYDAGHLVDLLDPLVDVRLVLVDVVLDDRDVVDYLLGVLGHYLDLAHQLTLLLHVHLLQLQDQLVLVLSQLLVRRGL